MSAESARREQPASDAPATGRKPLARDVPLEWLDALLVAVTEVEPSADLGQRVSALVDAAARVLPSCGFGVRLPGAAPLIRRSPRGGGTGVGDPVRLFPELASERVIAIDAGRRPSFEDSSIDDGQRSSFEGPTLDGGQRSSFEGPILDGGQRSSFEGPILDGGQRSSFEDPAVDEGRHSPFEGPTLQGKNGATLHVASDDEKLLFESPALSVLISRLVLALRASIRQARSHALLRDQIIQSDKLAGLGQLAAGVVHELNNPLTSILAYSDYLRRKGERAGNDPADLDRLARIHEAANRILRFSRDLITYSRPSTERPSAVSLHEILDRALSFCEHVLDQTRVVVERGFGDVAHVLGSPSQLTQVFVNLFTNAAHAMQEQGGNLRISTIVVDGGAYVRVTIRDDGHGIHTDHLPRIFEPFFTTKADGTGTGLGLSIVQSIVAAHGGRIRVDASGPRGTTFFVDLPAIAPVGIEP